MAIAQCGLVRELCIIHSDTAVCTAIALGRLGAGCPAPVAAELAAAAGALRGWCAALEAVMSGRGDSSH